MKRQRVDESPRLEDESAKVEDILADPKSKHVSVDGFLCFEKENLDKHLKMEDFCCDFDYGWINCGGQDSLHGQGDDLKLEVLDGLLDEVEEVDDILAANDLSGACGDFLLDIEFPEKFFELDTGPHQGPFLLNSTSESHSPGFSLNSNSAGGASESSIASVQESNHKNFELATLVSGDLCGNFRSKCGSQVPVMDSVCPSRQILDESDDEKPLVCFILSKKKRKGSVKVTKGSALLKQKRMQNPGRRCTTREFNRSSATVGNKRLKVRSQEALEVLSESQPRRGRPRKIVPKLEHEADHELSASESEDKPKRNKNSKTDCDRRKNQKMWTLAEVIKLVDGVAQFGVGRWTDIKRLLFASSAYRTPIDLRDKWRNLLKSSSALKQNRRESDSNLKHSVRSLPKPVALRIRELAIVHPYPRVRGQKFPPIEAPLPNAKNLRRKKCS